MRIAIQLRWLSVTLILVTAALIGSTVYIGYVQIAQMQQFDSLRQILVSDIRSLEQEVDNIKHNVRLLAQLPIVRTVAQAERERDTDDFVFAKTELQRVFTEIASSKPFYSQVRLIRLDENGQEMVRVEQLDGETTVIPDDRLQQKSGRDYFIASRQLQNHEVYVSKINLNRENGQIQVPYQPTVRFVAGVYDDRGQQCGIVVLNVRFDMLFRPLLLPDSESFQYIATNQEGYYLYHNDPERTFGFELPHGRTIATDHPSLAAFLAGPLSPSLREIADGKRQIVFGKSDMFSSRHENVIGIGVIATNVNLHESQNDIVRWAVAVTFTLILLAMFTGYLASSVLTRPLYAITQAANRIKEGGPVIELPKDRTDEIGVLATAFEEMAVTIKDKESELVGANRRLQITNSDLEHFTHLAAHDLREPARMQSNLMGLVAHHLREIEDDELHLLIADASRCSDQMLAMVQDFRTLTRVSEEQGERQPIDFDRIIDTLLQEFETTLFARQVVVQKDVHPRDLLGYQSYLELLYRNLVSNALAHASGDDFTLHFTADEPGDTWIFGVKNTGSSIPQDQLDEVFKMYRTIGGSAHSGTGVGLSLCKRIVDKHSGVIYAESGDDFTHIKFTLSDPNGTEIT
ncbi:sensor histidine kinase [Rhodopirellula sp. JC639]|uniref:sensor histidine kinase n=1 Tax=Stieleria mannarensis TaxID=2755585 RepID=UPI00160355E5|nr:sensor histidine kinase [Rhodopirellula sp. JC639]